LELAKTMSSRVVAMASRLALYARPIERGSRQAASVGLPSLVPSSATPEGLRLKASEQFSVSSTCRNCPRWRRSSSAGCGSGVIDVRVAEFRSSASSVVSPACQPTCPFPPSARLSRPRKDRPRPEPETGSPCRNYRFVSRVSSFIAALAVADWRARCHHRHSLRSRR
jgi:hypothetical protein